MPDFTFEFLGHLFIVSWYGLFVSAGLVLGMWWCYRRWPLQQNQKAWLALLCLLAGVVGSRLTYALVEPGTAEGLSWYGGQLVCMAILVLFSVQQRVSLPVLTDASTPPVLAMLALFRVGCLLADCCYGSPTTLPWGISHDIGHPMHTITTHPTALYEILILGGILIVLLQLEKKSPPTGTLTCLFLIAYSTARFLLDYIRGDRLMLFPELNLSVMQSVSLFMIALGVGIWVWLKTGPTRFMIKRDGFTLAELLLGLAILGVIATFTIPKVLNASRNEQHIAVAKETAAMVSEAWEKYKLQNGNAAVELRTAIRPHINYVSVYTGLIDNMHAAGARGGCTGGGNINCNDPGNGECFQLHNGAVVAFVKNGNALGIESSIGTSPNSFAIFVVDTNGKFDGLPSIVFGITRSGRVTPPEFIDPATWQNTNPSWFRW